MTTKLILDTDIGTDVDDAVALAYLLAQPECDLLGITTVTGEPVKRASLASVLCRKAGRDIPIYPGAEQPLGVEQRQPIAQHAAALPRWAHDTQFPEGQAVDFLRSTIHDNPGEVVLVTIGPLTNIAQLFQADAEVPALLKGLVIMGGIFTPGNDKAEWNLGGDPHASEIVYRTPVRLHRSLGLDVTNQVFLHPHEARALFTAPLLEPVLDFAEIWFTQYTNPPGITFHDPLTAAVVFDETLCTYARGTVTIDMQNQPGRSVFQAGTPDAPHQVATTVDVRRYMEHFFGVMNAHA